MSQSSVRIEEFIMEEPSEPKHPSTVFGNMANGLSILDPKSCTRKELILAGVAAIALLTILILGALLGTAYNQNDACWSAVNNPNACSTSKCLESAAYVAYTMNKTIDPCTDFYQYACGSYAKTRPIRQDRYSRSTTDDLYYTNKDKLKDLMLATYSTDDEWESDRKLKDLYTSCMDDFKSEQKLGKPFIDTVLSNNYMHGWYVLEGQVPNAFDLNHDLKVVQNDFHVRALYKSNIGLDWYDKTRKNNVLQLSTASSTKYMSWRYFDPQRSSAGKFQVDYRRYIKRLANLVVRDSGQNVPDKDTRIDTFVDDVMTMSSGIAALIKRSSVTKDRYSNTSRVSLEDLTTRSGNLISWKGLLMDEFPSLTGSSKIILFRTDYILGLTGLINGLDAANRNRIIHNYLIWRLMDDFAPHLSSEYLHANRELFYDVYNYEFTQPRQDICFSYVDKVMPDALGALFVRDHFADDSKSKVVELTKYVKEAIENEIKENTWMDSDTKKIAIDKLTKLKYKIGYPDYMLSKEEMNKTYASLTITASDYFQNVLNVKDFLKIDDRNKLSGGVDRDEWRYDIFSSRIYQFPIFNDISIPAGYLQFPVYSPSMPMYLNFGSIGTRLGYYLTRVIDQQGSKWTAQGNYVRATWYTNATKTAYDKLKQCVTSYYSNRTQGPYISPNGTSISFPIKGTSYVRNSIAYTTGVKIAYRAYEKWEKDNGVEKLAPTIGLSNEQMFFVSHAQSWCFNRSNKLAFLFGFRGYVQEDTRTNLILGQLPEFQKAFKCPVGAPLNSPRKCTYY